MEYDQQQAWSLLQAIPWRAQDTIRLFWMRYSGGRRSEFADSLSTRFGNEAVSALVVRKNSFFTANAVNADVAALFDEYRERLQPLAGHGVERLTVLLIGKEDFRLVQAASEVTLPEWFPVCAGLERTFNISDLAQTAEVRPMNCSEARIEHVSELLFSLEAALVAKLREVYAMAPARAGQFLQAIQQNPTPAVTDAVASLELFETHLASISDPRAYRPGAKAEANYLAARLLKLAINSAPKRLGEIALGMVAAMPNSAVFELKPSYFAMAWRPPKAMVLGQSNWHALLVAFFQAYQLMNGSAHAGEYPTYAVALQHSTSLDLRSCLAAARSFVEAQT